MTELKDTMLSIAEVQTAANLTEAKLLLEIEELVHVFDRVGDVPHAVRAAAILGRHRGPDRNVEYAKLVGHLPFAEAI